MTSHSEPDAAEVEAIADVIEEYINADTPDGFIRRSEALQAARRVIAAGYHRGLIADLQAQAAPWFRMHRAAEALQRDPDMANRLQTFVDYWGLDAYTPPEDVKQNVADLVHAFLLAAKGEDEKP